MKKKKTAVKKKSASKKKTAVKKKTVKKKAAPVQEAMPEQESDQFRHVPADLLKSLLAKALTKKNDFDLDALNESELNSFLKVLIGYIYSSHSLDAVVYKGLMYYNQPNQWNGAEPPDTDHDPLSPCTGYDECEFEKGRELVRIKPEKGEKIEYLLGLNGLNDEEDSILYQIHNVFSGSSRILHSKKLILQNGRFNDDHRGSDHTRIILDFPKEVELKPKATKMEDFTDALFRLRSHKFDNWYEMYYTTYTETDKNEIRIKVDFDHGS